MTESVAEICCVVANLNFVSSQEAELGHEEKLRNSLFIAGGKQPRLTTQFKMYLIVLQKVTSEANPKVRNHGEGPY